MKCASHAEGELARHVTRHEIEARSDYGLCMASVVGNSAVDLSINHSYHAIVPREKVLHAHLKKLFLKSRQQSRPSTRCFSLSSRYMSPRCESTAAHAEKALASE